MNSDKEQYEQIAAALVECGLLQQEQVAAFLEFLLSSRMTSDIGILPYFTGAFLLPIHIKMNEAAIGGIVQDYCNRFAEQMPELAFTDLQYEHTRGKKDCPHMVLVQFSSNGRTYRHRIKWYSEGNADMIAFYLHEIFNKVLTDLRSPLRLAVISETTYLKTDGLWIVPIRQAALEVLDQYLDWPWISVDNYSFNDFTSGRINDAIDTYRDCGLLSHLSEEEFRAARRRVEEKTIRSFSHILKEFPEVIYGFDRKEWDSEPLTNGFAAITHGDFSPTDIIDDPAGRESSAFTYGFTFNRQQYRTQVELDPISSIRELMMMPDLIARAMTEQNLPGRLYRLEAGEYSYEFIYLTPLQYERLNQEGIVGFGEWYR